MSKKPLTDADRLAHLLNHKSRPSLLELAEYKLGVLAPERMKVVEAYVRRHPHAAAELERLGRDIADEPPSRIDTIQTTLATLIGQAGGLRPAMAGIRGEVTGQFEADGVTITLETDTDPVRPNHHIVTGLLLGMATGSAELRSNSDPTTMLETAIDEDGEFEFEGVTSGDYALILRNADHEIVIPSMMV